MMITGKHIRAARAALGWGVRDLGSKAGIGFNTVSRFEASADALKSTQDKLQAALEAEGIEFLDSGIRWQD